MTSRRAPLIGLVVVLWSTCVLAQSSDATQSKSIAYGKTESIQTIEDWTQTWQLEEEDWEKYQTLMQGRYGLWYRQLDPVWILGFAAETEGERMRYARLATDIEERRVEDELAFQRAYDAAWKEKNPRAKVLDPFRLAARKASETVARKPSQSAIPNRRVAFVELACRACEDELRRQIGLARSSGIDIYIAGARSDDEIRQWARAMRLDLGLVRNRTVTLNHDAGYYEHLAGRPLRGMHFMESAQPPRTMSATE